MVYNKKLKVHYSSKVQQLFLVLGWKSYKALLLYDTIISHVYNFKSCVVVDFPLPQDAEIATGLDSFGEKALEKLIHGRQVSQLLSWLLAMIVEHSPHSKGDIPLNTFQLFNRLLVCYHSQL